MDQCQKILQMPCLYNTKKDLVDRLHGTFVRYKGEIRYLSFTSGKHPETKKACLGFLATNPEGTVSEFVPYDDPNLDISAFEVGYVNIDTRHHNADPESQTVYMARHPSKRYRQGFNPQNYIISSVDGVNLGWGIHSIMSIKESLMGDFPSMKSFLDSKKSVQAISSNVAVKRAESGVILVYVNRRNVAYVVGNKLSLKEDKISWIYERVLTKTFGDFYEINH